MSMRFQRGVVLLSVSIALAIVGAIAYVATREAAMAAAGVTTEREMDDARLLAEAGMNHARWFANTAGCASMPAAGSTKTVEGLLPGAGRYAAVISRAAADPKKIDVTATGFTPGGAQAAVLRTNLIPHQTAAVTGAAIPVGDTHIRNSAASANFGLAKYIEIAQSGTLTSRGLLMFDLNGPIRTGSLVKATLSLNLGMGAPADALKVAVRRSSAAWAEASATWQNRQAGSAWAAAGGDYAPADFVLTPAVANERYTADITELLEGWHANGHPELGMFLTAADGKTILGTVGFSTREDGGGGQRWPALNVTYKPACTALP